MSKEKPSTPRSKTPLTKLRMLMIAESLRYFADRFSELSQKAGEIEPSVVKAKSWRSLELGFEDISAALREQCAAFSYYQVEKIFGHPKDPKQETVIATSQEINEAAAADAEIAKLLLASLAGDFQTSVPTPASIAAPVASDDEELNKQPPPKKPRTKK